MADKLDRNDLKKISKARLREAKILYKEKQFDGSVYLAGYALETALKARICKILQIDYPPDGNLSKAFLTHNIKELIILSGLSKKLENMVFSSFYFKINWSVVTTWSEQFRYKKIGTNSKQDAKDIIEALDDSNYGVLTWIKKLW
jgi:putative cell wall-binding protein